MVRLIFLIVTFLFAFDCNDRLFTYSNSINKQERMSIDRFLKLLATEKCGVNVVYKDNIARKIVKEKMPYVRVRDYTFYQILDLILKQKGLFYTLNGDTLSISYFKTKTYKINFISSTRSGQSNLDATDSKVTNTYNFDFWSKVESQVTSILTNNLKLDPNYDLISLSNKDIFAPVVDKDSGIIVVTGTMKQLNAVDKYVNNLVNSLTKEVLIDVHIYSVELSKSHQTGINWANLNIALPSSSVPLRSSNIFGRNSVFKSATFNSEAFLNFLAQNGNVNSISNPKIVTLNNQKAIISVGDTIYYKYASSVVTDQNGNPQTQYTIDSKFVGVVLDITPQISDNGNIILSIAPRISKFRDPTQITNPTRDMPPDTTDNTMLSIVKLKDNQTLILGGLITDDKTFKANGVPILKEIPLIKYLFSSQDEITSKKELVFVITPHIITFNKKKTLRDLGFGKVK